MISQLNGASLALKVISGDNPLTTVQCAKQAGIIKEKEIDNPLVIFDKEDQYSYKMTTITNSLLSEKIVKWSELEADTLTVVRSNSTISLTGTFLTHLYEGVPQQLMSDDTERLAVDMKL